MGGRGVLAEGFKTLAWGRLESDKASAVGSRGREFESLCTHELTFVQMDIQHTLRGLTAVQPERFRHFHGYS